jgi:16S rRNA (guanine527-N7)-methyltransferase
LRHYVDSITISEHLPSGASVIDVGWGAGFPTLPLSIFRPDLSITSLDGTAKRIRYVQQTADKLVLKNVQAIAGRAEEYAQSPQFREKFDVATARAVAALPMLSELCLGFIRVGGQMIAMKSLHADEELALSQRGISLCGGAFLKKIEKHLVCDKAESEQRTLLFIQKARSTPKIYPRHFSKISKNPL